MSLEKIRPQFADTLAALDKQATRKGHERALTAIRPARADFGPRCLLVGYGDREFLRLNSNSYLGLSLHPEVIGAAEEAARRFGAGPGAVRFISGTCLSHTELEEKLARFHDREAGMLMSSAYATVMGVLPQLITEETLVVSDALNHNCIINAIRLAKPAAKAIYRHLDMADLTVKLAEFRGKVRRVVVVTDGVFSMRGDHAPLAELSSLCAELEDSFPEGIITVADDSHGVGVFGPSGRGCEEYTRGRVDILIGTLGKAFGVNGGYMVGDALFRDYLRETAPFYIYSNPITPAEAAAAGKALDILTGSEGGFLLEKLRGLRKFFTDGLTALDYASINGDHPIVPLMLRDTAKTTQLVNHLFAHDILATGLCYPVVPKGDEEIRFQLNASHTTKDLECVLAALQSFRDTP
ncbi:aminotransferase class I/II-fold pyridoxal phosphate-dependent enzyme [Thiovibrio frasassiensis]|uniref:Aminotransferase class I/II-fold pyridoxal phosphate-dependent enzyme n=1 Tax=Thiovibrio frasassiensis TaxID=2984131 RepID=A0A9X4RMF9_9BACT|nr:aminotransferase class I/II-fold pyridoxal phosphate-dependent enzyme [Thiovibrio frasassiensis]MDG4477051.1 aminotransferase class I/II-fold pyridoxal phosphate-dependent enzyme [Thiovibrio frasassiensis]